MVELVEHPNEFLIGVLSKKLHDMENINLIRKIAWSFHHSTGLEWDELFQEASLAYLEALATYDPRRGKITTYMWNIITSHLRNYLKHHACINRRLTSTEVVNIDRPVHPTPSVIERLSQDAQAIANIVLNDPEAFIALPPDEARHHLAEVLLNQGWTRRRVWCGINDLKLAFKN